MPLLPGQSITPYVTPFYAIVSLYWNAFFVPPIYDLLRYSFLCYCTNKLQCPCYQANLWHPTLLLFMLLYHCIEMLFLSHQSMSLYGTPFYAIVAINCNAFFCPTNQWPSTVLLFMLLHHCIAMHYFTQPIYDPLLYSFLCYCTYPNLWHSTVLGPAKKRRKCTKWWNPWPIYYHLRYIPFSLATIAQWYRNMSKLVWTCLVSSETVFRFTWKRKNFYVTRK